MFVLIIFFLYAYIYRNLLWLGQISFTDVNTPFLTFRDAMAAYSSPWLYIELGRPNTWTLGTYLLALGNTNILQKLWYLLPMPVSALTMYVLVISQSNSRLAKFVIPIAYSLSPISIEMFLLGQPDYLFSYMMFPIFLLFTLQTIEGKSGNVRRMLLACLVLGLCSVFNPQTMFYFFPFTVAYWVSTFSIKHRRPFKRHLLRLFELAVPYAFAVLTSSPTI